MDQGGLFKYFSASEDATKHHREHTHRHSKAMSFSGDLNDGSGGEKNYLTQFETSSPANKIPLPKYLSKTPYELRQEYDLDYSIRRSPLKEYLMLCSGSFWLANTDGFNHYILGCIILAGMVVGLQTYPAFETNFFVLLLDGLILYSFVFEVLLKLLAEGARPIYYFIGPEWRWNVFDFLIVFFSLPVLPFGAGQIKLLRLIRLMRLAKVFRKIPQLRMILEGLMGGLKSVAYIVVLMTLIFFLYAITGIFVFQGNDPWHFYSIEITMINLLRVAAFDGWGDIFYINYYGCDVYPADYYTDDPEEAVNKLGGLTYCNKPQAQPTLTALYFISFCFIAAFCIFSLFIGAVTMSMSDSVIEMKLQNLEIYRQKLKEQVGKEIKRLENPTALDRKTKRTVKLIGLAFTGSAMALRNNLYHLSHFSVLYFYKTLSLWCADFVEHHLTQSFITGVILLAGCNVGIVTDPTIDDAYGPTIALVDAFVQIVFSGECILKIIAEDVHPWMYFESHWNKFDFAVVLGSFLPTGSGSTVVILRLFRLLRVLKLMRALPQLQVIVTALMKGFSSIGFIGVILFLYFYFFAILATTFFAMNDPANFGTLHSSFLVLFRCVTLDNWAEFMYPSLYGCDAVVGYEGVCDHPEAQFIVAMLFFVSVILIGTLVLLSLFIGVVSMSMEEANLEQQEEKVVQDRTLEFAASRNLDKSVVDMYFEVFEMVDFTHQRKIGKDELKFGLRLAGVEMSRQDFDVIWRKVDKDKSHAIEFSEFLEFMIDLRDQQVILQRNRRFRKQLVAERARRNQVKGANDIWTFTNKTVDKDYSVNKHSAVVPLNEHVEEVPKMSFRSAGTQVWSMKGTMRSFSTDSQPRSFEAANVGSESKKAGVSERPVKKKVVALSLLANSIKMTTPKDEYAAIMGRESPETDTELKEFHRSLFSSVHGDESSVQFSPPTIGEDESGHDQNVVLSALSSHERSGEYGANAESSTAHHPDSFPASNTSKEIQNMNTMTTIQSQHSSPVGVSPSLFIGEDNRAYDIHVPRLTGKCVKAALTVNSPATSPINIRYINEDAAAPFEEKLEDLGYYSNQLYDVDGNSLFGAEIAANDYAQDEEEEWKMSMEEQELEYLTMDSANQQRRLQLQDELKQTQDHAAMLMKELRDPTNNGQHAHNVVGGVTIRPSAGQTGPAATAIVDGTVDDYDPSAPVGYEGTVLPGNRPHTAGFNPRVHHQHPYAEHNVPRGHTNARYGVNYCTNEGKSIPRGRSAQPYSRMNKYRYRDYSDRPNPNPNPSDPGYELTHVTPGSCRGERSGVRSSQPNSRDASVSRHGSRSNSPSRTRKRPTASSAKPTCKSLVCSI